jgi:hypothetical protein
MQRVSVLTSLGKRNMTEHHREPLKPFRRRRKHEGATWTPESQSALSEDGVWCKACRQRHGYMNLDMIHEKQGEAWVSHWVCRKTGNYIGELWLGDRND